MVKVSGLLLSLVRDRAILLWMFLGGLAEFLTSNLCMYFCCRELQC